MKKSVICSASLLVCFSLALFLASCNAEPAPAEQQEMSIEEMTRSIYLNDPYATYEDVENFVLSNMDVTGYVNTKGAYDYTPSALSLSIVDEMSLVDPSDFETKLDYMTCLYGMVREHASELSLREFFCLNYSIVISAEVIEMKYGVKRTRGLKSWVEKQWEDWGKCAAGIVGGAGKGALQGAADSIVNPSPEPIPGAVVGGIVGAMEGASEAC